MRENFVLLSADTATQEFARQSSEKSDWIFTQIYQNFAKVHIHLKKINYLKKSMFWNLIFASFYQIAFLNFEDSGFQYFYGKKVNESEHYS